MGALAATATAAAFLQAKFLLVAALTSVTSLGLFIILVAVFIVTLAIRNRQTSGVDIGNATIGP
jgi:hypothetical protein